MAHDDRDARLNLVRCPSCGTHRRRRDADRCNHCDDAAAPKRRSKSRSALIATALLGLSAFPACGDSTSKPDTGAQPAYGIPPIEASVDRGTAQDASPDRGADQQPPAPAYGIPPADAASE